MAQEQRADWDAQWASEPLDLEAPHREAETPRWRAQERLVRERFGGFDGLRAIEIDAGRGLNAFLFAERGARVTLLDEDTEQERAYQIVGDTEADVKSGRISISSPIARALIGKKVGDSVEVAAPGGARSYEVVKVAFD